MRRGVSSGTAGASLVSILLIAGLGLYYNSASTALSSDNSQLASQSSVISTQSFEVSSQMGRIAEYRSSVSSMASTVSSQSSEMAAQAAQMTSDEARITNLTSTISALQLNVSSLQSKANTYESEVGSLTARMVLANKTIAQQGLNLTAMQGQVSSLNDQIQALKGQISSLNAEIVAEQTHVSSLQSQVASLMQISSLESVTSLVVSKAFQTNSSGMAAIATFTAQYPGYISVSASSASDYQNDGVEVINVYSGSIASTFSEGCVPLCGYFYVFGAANDVLVFPILPGTVTVLLDTTSKATQSATVSCYVVS